jgi:NAD(P)-dependent dehydrogenase (short-subunit alcohol dehydrogenase family)
VQRFESVHALVTGASSGIGFAAAEQLAREGAAVVAVARDEARLQAAMRQWPNPERHLALPLDASDEMAVEKAFEYLREFQRPLSIGIFAAGSHAIRPLSLTRSAHIEQLFSSNVTSALLCTKAFSRQVPASGGSIVWLASAAGLVGNFGESIYAATKGALLSACRSLAVELGPRKIRINSVAPGVVRTPMAEAWVRQLTPDQLASVEKRHLLGFGDPADVAKAILFLASSDARWITGTCLVADGGFTCH